MKYKHCTASEFSSKCWVCWESLCWENATFHEMSECCSNSLVCDQVALKDKHFCSVICDNFDSKQRSMLIPGWGHCYRLPLLEGDTQKDQSWQRSREGSLIVPWRSGMVGERAWKFCFSYKKTVEVYKSIKRILVSVDKFAHKRQENLDWSLMQIFGLYVYLSIIPCCFLRAE